MKRIGLIGGISWHSTALYYQYINQEINQRLGKQHSADIVLRSVDFESVIVPWQQGQWDRALAPIIEAIKTLEVCRADFFLICSNAAHMFSDRLREATHLPMLHIGDIVTRRLKQEKINTVGLLGTKVTMNSDIYRPYCEKNNIAILTPTSSEQDVIDKCIFDELTKGIYAEETVLRFEKIMHRMHFDGAEGIILGCTELPCLFLNKTYSFPLFDTLKLHADAAVDEALTR